MKDWWVELLSCPVCGNGMKLFPGTPKRVVCGKGHSVDVSRWINFLTKPVSEHYHKALFTARRAIWESGLFDPLAEKIAGYVYGTARMHLSGAVSNHLSGMGKRSYEDGRILLDAGCGEGSPLMRILGYQTGRPECVLECQTDLPTRTLECQTDPPECVLERPADRPKYAFGCQMNSSEHIHAVGIDLAKDAIRMAAGLTKEVSWLVGDLTHLPLQNDGFDVVINLLSPACYEEFARVLKPGGLLVKVLPEEDYLKEIRELITVKKEAVPFVPSDEKKDVFSEDLSPMKITSAKNINQLLCTSEKNALVSNYQKTTKKQLLFTSREAITDRLNSHFQLIGSERLCYDGVVPADQKVALVRMTPMCADLSAEECMAVADRLGDKIRIDLRILTATPLLK